MSKNVWTRPLTMVQRFEANEYVAACENGPGYKFECNAEAGRLYYYEWGDGKIDGVYTGRWSADYIGSYSPCEDKHETSSVNDFYDGFVDYNRNGRQDTGEGVIVWIERSWGLIVDAHATSKLDMNSWDKTPS